MSDYMGIEVDELLDSVLIFTDSVSHEAWRERHHVMTPPAKMVDGTVIFGYDSPESGGRPDWVKSTVVKSEAPKWLERLRAKFLHKPEDLNEKLLAETKVINHG